MAITEQQQANRRIGIQALHDADESIRLQGMALEWTHEHGKLVRTPRMCACAVIAQGLGIPLLDEQQTFNYGELENALGENSIQDIYMLNDKSSHIEPSDVSMPGYSIPAYTFSEIGDKLAEDWGL